MYYLRRQLSKGDILKLWNPFEKAKVLGSFNWGGAYPCQRGQTKLQWVCLFLKSDLDTMSERKKLFKKKSFYLPRPSTVGR